MKANTSVVNVLFNQQKRIMPNYAFQAAIHQDKQKHRLFMIL